jgi:nitrate/nitrite transport system substrate-binding protein
MRAHARDLDAFSFCIEQGEVMHDETDGSRRRFLSQGALGTAALVAAMSPQCAVAVWAAGSDAPEKKEVKIGFIPLTDCASVVMAA